MFLIVDLLDVYLLFILFVTRFDVSVLSADATMLKTTNMVAGMRSFKQVTERCLLCTIFCFCLQQVPHTSFYVLIVMLYFHAYCAAKTLECDPAAAGLQLLKFAGMSFLLPFLRSIFSDVSPAEKLLLNLAELLGFGTFLAVGVYAVVTFNAKRKLL